MRDIDRTKARGWNDALKAIQRAMQATFEGRQPSESELQMLRLLGATCEQLQHDPAILSAPSNEVLAKRYACNVRTITNWRKRGAPLRSTYRMVQWLARQKSLPGSTEERFKGRIEKEKKRVFWRKLQRQVKDTCKEINRLERKGLL